MQGRVFHEAKFQPVEVEDCTLADLPCDQKICVCDAGKFGSFTEKKTARNGASYFARP